MVSSVCDESNNSREDLAGSTATASSCSASLSMPASKKRCWTLRVKDIKNNVKEAEVLSSFRKRYTSVRSLAFRRTTTDGDDGTSSGSGGTTTRTTATSNGYTALIELQFTGPQPIEGPAWLMCNLLQGKFVAAHPVQLGRGRKRKIRPGESGDVGDGAPPARRPFASAPRSTSDISSGETINEMECNVAAAVSSDTASITTSSNGGGGGSGSVTPVTATGIAESKMAEYDSSTSFSDTASSSSSTTSSGSDVDDLSEYLVEDTTTPATTTPCLLDTSLVSVTKTPCHLDTPLLPLSPKRNQPDNPESVGDISPTTLESDSICVGSLSLPAIYATATAATTAACDVTISTDQGRSSSVLNVSKDNGVVCDAESSPSPSPFSSSGGGHRLPPLNDFEEQPCTAAGGNAASSPSPFAPNVSATCSSSDYDCKEDAVSQEEALPLFAGSATGGVANSEDDLWGMTNDEADALFCRPPLGRLNSSSWGLDPVHTATVVANDNEDDNLDDESSSVDTDGFCWEPDGADKSSVASTAAVTVDEQQQPGGVEVPPVRGNISFGWCEEVSMFALAFKPRLGAHPLRPVFNERLPPPGPRATPHTHAQECDFDGRSTTTEAAMVLSSPFSRFSVSSRGHLIFQGLESAVQGRGLHDFAVWAQFSVEAGVKVERTASSLEVDASGCAHATVPYPSIQDIWPEIYKMSSVKVIEVDMVVEVRSMDGVVAFTGPTLKVTYRRASRRLLVPSIPMAQQNLTTRSS
ncbi:unnamed protein product [Pylaiella littoralis]